VKRADEGATEVVPGVLSAAERKSC